jgi:lipopolysaccharide export system protein LptC
MNGRYTIVFPIIVLAVLALITFWIDRTVQIPPSKMDGSSRHDVDYFLENFVTTKTDINGNLRNVLAATQMRHYPDDDSTELMRPRFTQYGENKPYTQIEGQKGFVSANGEMVEFKGNVTIVRQAFEGRGEMHLKTDYLKIFPNEDKAMTDSPVTITQDPKTVITGTGMTYDKTDQSFTLHQRVKVHYEKPKSDALPLPKEAASDKVNPNKATTKTATKKQGK